MGRSILLYQFLSPEQERWMEPAGAWPSLPGLPRWVNRIRFEVPNPDADPPRLREPGLRGARGAAHPGR